MKISKKKGQPRWYKFESDGESCEFNIRPFPYSRLSDADVRMDVSGNATVGLNFEWHRFDACLQGWKGLEDDDGKEFKYNIENKKYLYDYDDELRNFVLNKSKKLDESVGKELKN